MIKKGATLVAILLGIFFLTLTIASATSDVAYIYRQRFNVDNNVLRLFNQSNLTYDLINERNLPINFAPYRFIYAGDENFRNANRILVNQYPSIIANYYHAQEWGLTDDDGVSQLGGTAPLSVLQNGRMIEVYTQAREYPGGPSVEYYYLGEDNEADGLESVAMTETTASGMDVGDVIAYARPGAHMTGGVIQHSKLCFFGIIESNYWTPAARSLFQDCLGFVSAECSVNSDCPAPTFSQPFCQNGGVYRTVTRNSCQPSSGIPRCVANQSVELVQDCPFDCQNGQCIGQCGQNSDCGADGPISNFFCSANINVTRTYQLFTCHNPGTANSTCSSVRVNRTEETCNDICINGACEDIVCSRNADCNDNNVSTQDTCHNPGTVQSFCTNEPIRCTRNLDCGVDGFIGSVMCTGLNITRVFESFVCHDPGTATSFCTSARENRTVQQCADACVNGQCGDITCRRDSDCNDQNPLTHDQCLNPGTVISECRHNPINCAADSDCGTTGFMGNEFCSANNDVVKLFQNATCNNPGTPQSSCSVTQQNRVIEDCPSICSNGHCVNPRCSRDADCNDNNPLTSDQCINPNTTISECRHNPINCASNADCGFTGFVGEEYCSVGNAISKNFQNSLCINPGTGNSYCNVTIEQRPINTCPFACFDGSCVRCDSGADCNDNNPNTADICNNAGTETSFCSNPPTGGGNVTCTVNSDCGQPTPLSPEFCSANNVSRLVRTWTCNNGGSSQSYCSSSIVTRVVTTCPQFCSNGDCVAIECFNNADCNDHNSSTVDICENPGTSQSNCVNNPVNVNCYRNSDCGADGFIDGPFCTLNNVTRLFQSFVCNNPSTPQSYCSTSVSPLNIQHCEFTCANGQCLPRQGECTPGEIRPCGTDVGECRGGINVCFSNARWSNECFGGVGPIGEVCNNLDDDCDGVTDEGGVCGGGCSNECPSNGARECNANGYRTCGNFDSDNCLEWSTTTACPTGQTCSNGQCQTTCTNDCSSGERRCSGNGFQTCGQFDSDTCLDWGTTTSCLANQTCQLGSCVNNPPTCSNECVSGTRDCSGNGYRMCGNFDSDSCTEWSQVTSCLATQTCQSGLCVNNPPTCTNQCTDGAQRCSGNGYQICHDFNGDSCTEWSQATQCSSGQVCISGSCITPPPSCSNECTSGSQRCSGNGVQSCGNYDSDSCTEWGAVSSCSSGQTCIGGQCQTTCTNQCTSGQRQCLGNGYQMCGDFNNDGCSEWSQATQCSTGQTCTNGLCVNNPPMCSNDCSTNDRRCSGNGVQTCGQFDSDTCLDWSSTNACGSGQVCILGTCTTPTPTCSNQCTDGARRCSNNGYQICHDYNGDSCTEWSQATMCSFGQVCIGGVCS